MSDDFRAEAKDLGLIVDFPGSRDVAPRHFFDLNQGSFYTKDNDDAKVRQLVELARKHASDDGYGEHNSMLALVAYREDLVRWQRGERKTLIWHRSYHLIPKGVVDEEEFISLREYLKECGQEPKIRLEE